MTRSDLGLICQRPSFLILYIVRDLALSDPVRDPIGRHHWLLRRGTITNKPYPSFSPLFFSLAPEPGGLRCPPLGNDTAASSPFPPLLPPARLPTPTFFPTHHPIYFFFLPSIWDCRSSACRPHRSVIHCVCREFGGPGL